MVLRHLAMVALIIGAWSAIGCGRPDVPVVPEVKGTVTLNGAALTEGTVNFTAAHSGNAAIAHLGAEGKFIVVGGIVPGEYKVTVTPPTPTPENPTPKSSDIPDKYRSEETTDLTAKITSKANELIFDLKS